MRYIKYSLFLVSTMLISGCAELSAINDKVGDWAGQMNQTLYGSKDGSVEQHMGDKFILKPEMVSTFIKIPAHCS